MKKLLFLAALLSAPAFAGDRSVVNPDLNGNLLLKVNDGTDRTAVLISGSTTNLTLGTSVSTQHTVIGPISHTYSGYNGSILGDSTGMKIGHNSSARTLELQTNSTTRASISATDGVVTLNNSGGSSLPAINVSVGSGDTRLIGTTGASNDWNLVRVDSTATDYIAFRDEDASIYPWRLEKGAVGDAMVIKSDSSWHQRGVQMPWHSAWQTSDTACASPGVCSEGNSYGGGIASVVRGATAGLYTVNFTTSFWSAIPICLASSHQGNEMICFPNGRASFTSQAFVCTTASTGVAVDARFIVQCTGLR